MTSHMPRRGNAQENFLFRTSSRRLVSLNDTIIIQEQLLAWSQLQHEPARQRISNVTSQTRRGEYAEENFMFQTSSRRLVSSEDPALLQEQILASARFQNKLTCHAHSNLHKREHKTEMFMFQRSSRQLVSSNDPILIQEQLLALARVQKKHIK